MNKARRKEIDALITKAEALQEEYQGIVDLMEAFKEKAEELAEEVDQIKADEEEYRDNMPENLNGSERYSIADSAIGCLETARDYLADNDFVDMEINSVITELENAKE